MSTGGGKLGEMEREYGGYQAERAVTEQKWAALSASHQKLEADFEANPEMPCPTCGQPMKANDAEKHVAQTAHDIERCARAMRTFDTKMHNTAHKMDNLKKGSAAECEGIAQNIAASRESLEQIGTALAQFSRLNANKLDAARRLTEARAVWEKQDKIANPFVEKQKQMQAQMDKSETKLQELQEQAAELGKQADLLEFWNDGFGSKGLPVLVLRTALYELETYANKFLAQLLNGKMWCQLAIAGDDLQIQLFENKHGVVRERRYEQLSGGQRRCIELAFNPFALSEMVFNRCGVRIPLLIIDELTTHLGQEQKPLVCDILRGLERSTVLVIDHDAQVQGEFDTIYEVESSPAGVLVRKAAA